MSDSDALNVRRKATTFIKATGELLGWSEDLTMITIKLMHEFYHAKGNDLFPFQDVGSICVYVSNTHIVQNDRKHEERVVTKALIRGYYLITNDPSEDECNDWEQNVLSKKSVLLEAVDMNSFDPVIPHNYLRDFIDQIRVTENTKMRLYQVATGVMRHTTFSVRHPMKRIAAFAVDYVHKTCKDFHSKFPVINVQSIHLEKNWAFVASEIKDMKIEYEHIKNNYNAPYPKGPLVPLLKGTVAKRSRGGIFNSSSSDDSDSDSGQRGNGPDKRSRREEFPGVAVAGGSGVNSSQLSSHAAFTAHMGYPARASGNMPSTSKGRPNGYSNGLNGFINGPNRNRTGMNGYSNGPNNNSNGSTSDSRSINGCRPRELNNKPQGSQASANFSNVKSSGTTGYRPVQQNNNSTRSNDNSTRSNGHRDHQVYNPIGMPGSYNDGRVGGGNQIAGPSGHQNPRNRNPRRQRVFRNYIEEILHNYYRDASHVFNEDMTMEHDRERNRELDEEES